MENARSGRCSVPQSHSYFRRYATAKQYTTVADRHSSEVPRMPGNRVRLSGCYSLSSGHFMRSPMRPSWVDRTIDGSISPFENSEGGDHLSGGCSNQTNSAAGNSPLKAWLMRSRRSRGCDLCVDLRSCSIPIHRK